MNPTWISEAEDASGYPAALCLDEFLDETYS